MLKKLLKIDADISEKIFRNLGPVSVYDIKRCLLLAWPSSAIRITKKKDLSTKAVSSISICQQTFYECFCRGGRWASCLGKLFGKLFQFQLMASFGSCFFLASLSVPHNCSRGNPRQISCA